MFLNEGDGRNRLYTERARSPFDVRGYSGFGVEDCACIECGIDGERLKIVVLGLGDGTDADGDMLRPVLRRSIIGIRQVEAQIVPAIGEIGIAEDMILVCHPCKPIEFYGQVVLRVILRLTQSRVGRIRELVMIGIDGDGQDVLVNLGTIIVCLPGITAFGL